MTFRTRLLVGFGVVVLLPLAVFGLGIRREMARRLAVESQDRVTSLVRIINADFTHAGDGIAGRLAALKDQLAADNRFRAALLQGTDRAYVLDYAGGAMRLAGLDFLQFVDEQGRILSSGHFRNEYDRRAHVPAPLATVLIRARTAEGPFLALIRADSLRLAGRRLALVGGVGVGSEFLARLATDTDLVVSIVPPGVTLEAAGSIVGEFRYPYFDAENEAGTGGQARIVVTQTLPLLDALRRDVNFWFGAAVLVTALVALLVAGWLSTRFSRPVTQMEHRAALGDLARQVNHDIKNAVAPLRNVFRHLAQVSRGEPVNLPRVFVERQETVESSLTYLETLAANYARLSPKLDARPSDVNAVVREALANASTDATEHAELVTELPDGLPKVRADSLVLRRVIENLVGNALDSLEGRPGTVSVATARGDGVVRITVGDTGRGMSPEELARAFDDFYTTKPGGTGLGLSIVRRLVMDAAGTLRVDTAPGKGSKFIVELPVA